MKLSLKQARRVEREIGTELDINTQAESLGGHLAISIHEDFVTKLQTIQEKALETARSSQEALRIRYNIRKQIETENEVSGINALMNREAFLRANAKVLTGLMSGELTNEEVKIASARHAAAVQSGGVQSHYGLTDTVALHHTIFTSTMDQLRERAKEVQRELITVVEKLTAMNSTRTVVLEDKDVEHLEKMNIVVNG